MSFVDMEGHSSGIDLKNKEELIDYLDEDSFVHLESENLTLQEYNLNDGSLVKSVQIIDPNSNSMELFTPNSNIQGCESITHNQTHWAISLKSGVTLILD